MASGNGQVRYRVSYLAGVLDRLKEWSTLAAERKLVEEYKNTLRRIDSELTYSPRRWGEPQFDYHQLGMTRLRGNTPMLIVYYAIHEAERIVIVQEVQLDPHGPLSTEGRSD